MPLYPLIAFRKAEVTCKQLEETAKDTPAFFEALKTKEAARKALEKAAKEREVALKTLKEVQKNCTELAIAANKAQGATQKARKAANITAPEATNSTHTADKKKVVVQTEQAANEMVVTEGVGETVVGRCSRWNIGEGAVNKAHHNWYKIFGDKKPSLADIEPYVKEALQKGEWKAVCSVKTKGNKEVVFGTKIKLVHKSGDQEIWVLGTKTLDGEIIINNAGVS